MKIKELELCNGDRVAIKLDKETGDFLAKYEGRPYKNKNLEELERDILNYAKEHFDLKYEPMIAVISSNWGHEKPLGFEYERYFRALKNDGSYSYKKANTIGTPGRDETYDDILEIEPQSFRTSYISMGDGSKEIPYTKERWQALRHIEKQIIMLREKLKGILMGDESEGFLQKIIDNRIKLLPFEDSDGEPEK